MTAITIELWRKVPPSDPSEMVGYDLAGREILLGENGFMALARDDQEALADAVVSGLIRIFGDDAGNGLRAGFGIRKPSKMLLGKTAPSVHLCKWVAWLSSMENADEIGRAIIAGVSQKSAMIAEIAIFEARPA